MTSLHIAARFKDEDLVRLLLEEGHSPNVVETRLFTPLCQAVARSSRPIIKLLLEHGASIDLPVLTNGGITALHVACSEGSSGLLELLLAHGGDPNCEDSWGETLLHRAVMDKRLEVVEILLKHRAGPDLPDVFGVSPLLKSLLVKDLEMMKLLLKNGANPNVTVSLDQALQSSL